ncbi:hypothetical protein CWI75_05325 [Kineobactrum sediminis]|uniref:DUF1254 domain-containing protein n=1 Tax=Kineobactrum sediminis TaxID=1905677 RepID=A0A2N5Y388_9GAMM|nr:DUF1214 domain-containing protein [Kineobactrum sediminis]PLW82872.1 hypothetical protein CWI75_05325 [Kineobactrum sediminis]
MNMKLVWGVLVATAITWTLGFSPVGHSQPVLADIEKDDAALEEWAYSLGLQAYAFGLPLTVYKREYVIRTDREKVDALRDTCCYAMINEVGHKFTLSSANDGTQYSPNFDTVYSAALVDSTDEPIILSVPDIPGRYWGVEVANPYTENLFYLGSRATDGKGGHHAFIAPGWEGTLPDGVVPHRLEYSSAMFILRIGVAPGDDDDIVAVNALQRQVKLTSLSNFRAGKLGEASMPASAREMGRASGAFAVFYAVADLMGRYPPDASHQSLVSQFAVIGLVPGQPFDPAALKPPIRRGLLRALETGPGVMSWKYQNRGRVYQGVWDHLPEGRWGYDYLGRAAGATAGLFLNDREEALYISTFKSSDGEYFDGSKSYQLHFAADELPPMLEHGFWSFTMYGPDFRMVKNSINRFAISDRDEGVEYNEDGSLDIYIQHTPPEGHESNWLPAPAEGLFRIIYRIYLPEEAVHNPETLGNYIPYIGVSD